MKILTTGIAVTLFCIPALAQTTTMGQELSKFHDQARGHFHNKAIEHRENLNDDSDAVGTLSKKSVHGGTSNRHGNTTIVVSPGYGYPAPYAAYGYPAPYPYPYPAPYGYPAPYPYPYPSNTIVGAPIAPPTFSWERPAYATSIPLGTTYYTGGHPHYPCPPYPYGSYPQYGYAYKQSNSASLSIGTGSVRVNIGSSRTTIR